jgi:hypothetical protein
MLSIEQDQASRRLGASEATILRAQEALNQLSIDTFQQQIFQNLLENSLIARISAADEGFMPVALPLYLSDAEVGAIRRAETLSAALLLLEAGIYALDHLMDNELCGPLASLPKAAVMTAATCFLSYIPHRIIAELDCDIVLRERLAASLYEGLAQIGHGQLLDVSFTVDKMPSPQLVERCVIGKTGARRGLYARMAAQLAGQSVEATEAYAAFGNSLGVARQLNSDIEDIFAAESSRDVESGACTLPFAFYFADVDPSEAEQMIKFIGGARYDPAALSVVRSRLRDSGALRKTLVRKEAFCARALQYLRAASKDGQTNELLANAVSQISWRQYASR